MHKLRKQLSSKIYLVASELWGSSLGPDLPDFDFSAETFDRGREISDSVAIVEPWPSWEDQKHASVGTARQILLVMFNIEHY